jgi:hypothetical protein
MTRAAVKTIAAATDFKQDSSPDEGVIHGARRLAVDRSEKPLFHFSCVREPQARWRLQQS